jgi:predicted nucleic acid-binding protein
MDVCAINRPFDDLSVERNLAEAEAVQAIVNLCRESGWEILWSEAMEMEFGAMDKDALLARVRKLLPKAAATLSITDETRKRAARFEGAGVGYFDSLHLALAEKHGTVFLTTDKRLLKKAMALCADLDLGARLRIRPLNPIEWLKELTDGRQKKG